MLVHAGDRKNSNNIHVQNKIQNVLCTTIEGLQN